MKVIIIGWFGEKNIGDDLILDSSVEVVKEAYNPEEIFVSSNHKIKSEKFNWIFDHDFSIKSWIKLFLRGNFIKNIIAWFQSDIVVFSIGGGLSDWNKVVAKRVIRKIRFFKLLNKKMYFLGVGAGPFVNNYDKKILYKHFNKVDHFYVRDKTSYNNLINLGLKQVTLTNDIVFENKNIKSFFNRNTHIPKKNQVAIIPVPLFYNDLWQNHTERFEKYIKSFDEMTSYLSSKYEKVLILPFQKEFDSSYLLKFLNNTNIEIMNYTTYEQVYEEIISSELIIPMRFHGLVLSTIFQVPMIPVVYDHKLYDLAVDLNVEELILNLGDGVNWKDSIFEIEDLINKHSIFEEKHKDIVSECIRYKNNADKNLLGLENEKQ